MLTPARGRAPPAAALPRRPAPRRRPDRRAAAGTKPLRGAEERPRRRHHAGGTDSPAHSAPLRAGRTRRGGGRGRRRAAPRGSPALPSPAVARRSGCTSCTGSPATCRTACAPSAARSSRGCGSGHTWADAAASSPPRRRPPLLGRSPCGPPSSRSRSSCPVAPRRPGAC